MGNNKLKASRRVDQDGIHVAIRRADTGEHIIQFLIPVASAGHVVNSLEDDMAWAELQALLIENIELGAEEWESTEFRPQTTTKTSHAMDNKPQHPDNPRELLRVYISDYTKLFEDDGFSVEVKDLDSNNLRPHEMWNYELSLTRNNRTYSIKYEHDPAGTKRTINRNGDITVDYPAELVRSVEFIRVHLDAHQCCPEPASE